jgi:hypothetical protein
LHLVVVFFICMYALAASSLPSPLKVFSLITPFGYGQFTDVPGSVGLDRVVDLVRAGPRIVMGIQTIFGVFAIH